MTGHPGHGRAATGCSIAEGATSAPGRIIVDISTLARWTGPPVGMIRVEQEVAKAARASGGASLAFYDPRCRAFRPIKPEWADRFLGWHAAIDTWGMDYSIDRRGWRRWVPSRYPVLRALERLRLQSRSPALAAALEALQALVLSVRPHRFPFKDPQGRRISLLPPDLALGPAYELDAGDVVLSPASDWQHKDLDALAALKQRTGFRLIAFCFDIIPLTHPQFFPAADVASFAAFWRRMFPTADTVIVNSRAVRDDALRYCAEEGLPAPDLALIPLGCDPPRAGVAGPLPAGLEPERYALFVSTIEPRKNHALLLRVWRELLARGVPQSHGFKLVFVGRPGWMVDEVLREIADRQTWQGTLLHLQGINDRTLDALYAQAAFCLYPSLYEGFGLPVVEAFARGKAVIASTGGSLAEVAGPLAPCLDPQDESAWAAAIEAWIADPEARRAAERRVRAGYAYPTWPEVAQRMFAEAQRLRAPDLADRSGGGSAIRGPSR